MKVILTQFDLYYHVQRTDLLKPVDDMDLNLYVVGIVDHHQQNWLGIRPLCY